MRPDFVNSYHDPSNGAPAAEAACVRRGREPHDADDYPFLESIRARRRRGWDSVCTRPEVQRSVLLRWLRAQSGRPWNDVYSELCSVADSRSRPGCRLREDVRREVCFDAEQMPDGTWVERGRRSWGSLRSSPRFWVDGDGILRAGSGARRSRAAAKPVYEPERYVLGGLRELHRIEGLWYEVAYAPVPPPRVTACVDSAGRAAVKTVSQGGGFDVLRRHTVYADERPDRYGRVPARTYAVSKRALSRAELRRHELANLMDRAASPARRVQGVPAGGDVQ